MLTFPVMHFSEAPPTCTYVDGRESAATLTNYSFSSVNLGAPSPTRLIVVCVAGYRDAGGTVASATIGGVTATIHLNTSIGNGSIATISAIVPTGETGTVTINWSTLQAATTIDVYAIDNIKSTTPDFTAVDTTSPLSQSITYDPNTIVIAHAKTYTTGSFTWSGSAGLIEQADHAYDGTNTHSSAMKIMPASGSGVGVTVTYSGTLSGFGLHIIGFK